MSLTSQVPSNREWLRRLVSGQPHQVIGGTDRPYLRRWYLIPRNPVLNVYLHQFLRSDDDRALHDHPWWFVSLILRGDYVEVMQTSERRTTALYRTSLFDIASSSWRRCIAFRSATHRHRVSLPVDIDTGVERPCWTLIVTGRRTRTWGFWCRRLIDTWSAETYDELDKVAASTTGQVEVERFVPWTEFGDAGCGEIT